MKLFYHLLAVAWFVLLPLALKAQGTAPKLKFKGKNPLVVYQTDKEQEIPVEIEYELSGRDSTAYHIVVEVTQSNTDKDVFSPKTRKMTFGAGYDPVQTLKIKLSADTSLTLPCMLKVTMKFDGTNREIGAGKEIFYQPSSDVSKTIENKLIKSADDLKSDLSTLRAQLLDGDTSRTYIGKLVINGKATVLENRFNTDFKSKIQLDESINKARLSKLHNLLITDTITKTKYLSIPVKSGVNKSDPDNYAKLKDIDSVVVKITEGMIEYIRVELNDNSYYINNSPVSLLTIEKHFDQKLENPQDGSFIFLKDAINFVSEKRFNFFPSDAVLYLNNGKVHPIKEVKVFANNGLNSFVDFRVFTDLLGAINNQANGLLQIEAKSKIYLHRYARGFIYPFYALEPYFGLSKFDSKYDTIKITQPNQPVKRMEFFQRSFLNVGLKLNLLRMDFRPSNSFYINAGYQFNATNLSVRDSKNEKDSIETIGMLHTPYFEAGLSSTRLSNFGFDGSAKFMLQHLNASNYYPNSGYSRLMNFAVTLFYYPGTKPKDKFFVRFSNYLNFDDRRQDFYQLQFGYSLNLKL